MNSLRKLLRPGGQSRAYPSTLRSAGEGAAQVLVIGDSWADISGLEHGLAETLGGRAFTYGYSGHTSAQIAAKLARGDIELLRQAVGPVRAVVFLVGVNDAYLHVGAGAYGRAVSTLRSLGAVLSEHVFVVALPRVDMNAPARWWGARAKRLLFRWLFDGGEADATDRYRRAIAPDLSFDDFIPAFRAHEASYAPDGLHLQPERYVDLGRHLGRQLALCDPGRQDR